MRSVILPTTRFAPRDDTTTVLDEPASGNLLAQVIRRGNIRMDSYLNPPSYTHGFLNSYSVYAHTHGLNFGTNKSISQLLEDIDHYTSEYYIGVEFENYTLLTDEIDLAKTQIWSARTYSLAQTPDTSLPHFPEEDFED